MQQATEGVVIKCITPGCKADAAPGGMFCRVHAADEPCRRGGWLSAYLKKQRKEQRT